MARTAGATGPGGPSGVIMDNEHPDPNIVIRVECYAGHRGEETPRRFHLDGRAIEVAEVIDRWLAPDHRYFKVRSVRGATYILRHDVATGAWELVMYERAAGPPGARRA